MSHHFNWSQDGKFWFIIIWPHVFITISGGELQSRSSRLHSVNNPNYRVWTHYRVIWEIHQESRGMAFITAHPLFGRQLRVMGTNQCVYPNKFYGRYIVSRESSSGIVVIQGNSTRSERESERWRGWFAIDEDVSGAWSRWYLRRSKNIEEVWLSGQPVFAIWIGFTNDWPPTKTFRVVNTCCRSTPDDSPAGLYLRCLAETW